MEKIEKEYKFKDFTGSIGFVNQVAKIAEARDHHPDILIKYNVVMLSFYTHTANGVTEKDVRLAAEIDAMLKGSQKDFA